MFILSSAGIVVPMHGAPVTMRVNTHSTSLNVKQQYYRSALNYKYCKTKSPYDTGTSLSQKEGNRGLGHRNTVSRDWARLKFTSLNTLCSPNYNVEPGRNLRASRAGSENLRHSFCRENTLLERKRGKGKRKGRASHALSRGSKRRRKATSVHFSNREGTVAVKKVEGRTCLRVEQWIVLKRNVLKSIMKSPLKRNCSLIVMNSRQSLSLNVKSVNLINSVSLLERTETKYESDRKSNT